MMVTLACKVFVLALICIGYHLLPFNLPDYQANFIYPFGEAPNFWTPFKTWDGQIYLYLADQGYHPGQFTNAFYPLFPFLVRVAGLFLGGEPLWGGLLLSHVFTFLALAYLYRLGRDLFDERTAFFGCLFLLSFPMGFYLGLLYTESLFLFLAAAYFYYWSQKRYGWAAVFAFLLPLTRPTGILVFLSCLAVLMEPARRKERLEIRQWIPFFSFALGEAIYLLAMKAMTGNAFCAFEAEKSFIFHFDAENLLHPLGWLANFIGGVDARPPGTLIKLINRAAFLGYLWVLWKFRKNLGRAEFIYCAVLGLVPALTGNLGSYMRYLLVLFPLFMVVAWKSKGKEVYVLSAFSILQACFVVLYSLNYFVS